MTLLAFVTFVKQVKIYTLGYDTGFLAWHHAYADHAGMTTPLL